MSAHTPDTAPVPLVEPWLPAGCAEAVRDQVLSGFIGPGATTKAFAEEIARLAGVAHCTLTPSGTVALTVAAHALGLRAGDEILVPAYGVISTINGFASAGLRPRLVDVDASGCMDVECLAAALTSATRAVCFVDFSGYTGANLAAAAAICESAGVPLVEDAAGAIGHRHEDRPAGSFGTMAIYSFSVPKVITTGQGGAVLTSDTSLAERAAAYVDQGDLDWRRTNLNRDIGTNLRFTDILASVGLPQARTLPDRLARRRAAHAELRNRLGDYLYAVPGGEAPLHNIVFTREADRLVAALATRRIAAVRQYRTISQHPAYSHLAGAFPNADVWTERAVYLPFGVALTPEAASRVADAVLAAGIPLEVPARWS